MSTSNNSSGASTLGILGVAFIILKLCKIISWSWWLVLLPFYGGIIVALIIIVFAFFMTFRN